MATGVRGTSTESLDAALQDLAQKLVRREQQQRGLDDSLSDDQKLELGDFFVGNFHKVRIEIELQPHNQWIRTFSAVHD